MSATGHSAKPQIKVIQPAALTASAHGCPRVLAICPGREPAMQNTPIALAIRTMRTIQAKMSRPDISVPSTGRLRFGKLPFAVQDFRSRTIEPHRVVPAFCDRQTVRHLAVAAAELNGDDAVTAFSRRQIVERIG